MSKVDTISMSELWTEPRRGLAAKPILLSHDAVALTSTANSIFPLYSIYTPSLLLYYIHLKPTF